MYYLPSSNTVILGKAFYVPMDIHTFWNLINWELEVCVKSALFMLSEATTGSLPFYQKYACYKMINKENVMQQLVQKDSSFHILL